MSTLGKIPRPRMVIALGQLTPSSGLWFSRGCSCQLDRYSSDLTYTRKINSAIKGLTNGTQWWIIPKLMTPLILFFTSVHDSYWHLLYNSYVQVRSLAEGSKWHKHPRGTSQVTPSEGKGFSEGCSCQLDLGSLSDLTDFGHASFVRLT